MSSQMIMLPGGGFRSVPTYGKVDAFAVFWFGVAWLAWRSAVNSTGYVKAIGIGVLGVWAYLSVHHLFDNLFVQHMQLQLALLVGVLVAVRERQAPAS